MSAQAFSFSIPCSGVLRRLASNSHFLLTICKISALWNSLRRRRMFAIHFSADSPANLSRVRCGAHRQPHAHGILSIWEE